MTEASTSGLCEGTEKWTCDAHCEGVVSIDISDWDASCLMPHYFGIFQSYFCCLFRWENHIAMCDCGRLSHILLVTMTGSANGRGRRGKKPWGRGFLAQSFFRIPSSQLNSWRGFLKVWRSCWTNGQEKLLEQQAEAQKTVTGSHHRCEGPRRLTWLGLSEISELVQTKCN